MRVLKKFQNYWVFKILKQSVGTKIIAKKQTNNKLKETKNKEYLSSSLPPSIDSLSFSLNSMLLFLHHRHHSTSLIKANLNRWFPSVQSPIYKSPTSNPCMLPLIAYVSVFIQFQFYLFFLALELWFNLIYMLGF